MVLFWSFRLEHDQSTPIIGCEANSDDQHLSEDKVARTTYGVATTL